MAVVALNSEVSSTISGVRSFGPRLDNTSLTDLMALGTTPRSSIKEGRTDEVSIEKTSVLSQEPSASLLDAFLETHPIFDFREANHFSGLSLSSLNVGLAKETVAVGARRVVRRDDSVGTRRQADARHS